jgi:ActD protein
MNAAAYVLGITRDEQAAERAVEELRGLGYRDVETFSPLLPEEHAAQSQTSPVRFYALAGGITGLLSGLLLTTRTALAWPMLTGGKPIVSIPPFLVITFEMTVLGAGLFTVAGLVIHAGLMRSAPRKAPAAAYDARFSADRFGVLISCTAEQAEAVKQQMLAAGMEEVRTEPLQEGARHA